jgi:CRISPR/Cas system-associated protein Cas7 (RAMP superfamily)
MEILDLCIRKDNIKTDLKEVGWGVTDWIDLAQDRDRWQALLNAVMNLRVQYNAGNFLTSFSRRILLHGVSKRVSRRPYCQHSCGDQ